MMFIPKWRRPEIPLLKSNYPFQRWAIPRLFMRRKSKLNNVLWKLFNLKIREKSRVSWLKDGDKCSKFFHTYAKFKGAKAFIHALSIDDVLVDDKQTIADHVVQYYQELYSSTSSCISSAEMSSIIPSLVTENDNNFLTAIPTDEEIKSCVFSMDPGSAPGPDGFNVAFYQSCWHIVGDDVCRGVRQFFQSSWLYPLQLNFLNSQDSGSY